jgi:hypothetical protein
MLLGVCAVDEAALEETETEAEGSEKCSFTVNIPAPSCTKESKTVADLRRKIETLAEQLETLQNKYEKLIESSAVVPSVQDVPGT